MRRSLYILTATVMLLAGCSGKPESAVRFHRFEHLLFNTPLSELQKTLVDSMAQYSTPLLNVAPGDPQFMQALAGFVTDPEVRRIYNVTDSLYNDLSWLEAELFDNTATECSAPTTSWRSPSTAMPLGLCPELFLHT